MGEQSDDPLLGESLDSRFRLDKCLGEGAMGRVYLARQMSVDRDVAVKVLHQNLTRNEVIAQRFLREAKVISGFEHSNIVNLIDFGQDDEFDLLYLVMEHLDGVDLSSLLAEGRFTPRLAVDVVDQVCAALTEPHAQDVVHRDLKPANLMVRLVSDGSIQVKVLDFGIAHVIQSQTKLTGTNAVCGTPHYMSPEQVTAEAVGPQSDIYSLGIGLFEMLTGTLPSTGETTFEVMYGHVESDLPSLGEVVDVDSLPDGLPELVDDMMAKDPADRPDGIHQVRDRLEAISRRADLRPIRVDPSSSIDEALAEWIDEPVEDPPTILAETTDATALGETREKVRASLSEDRPGEEPDDAHHQETTLGTAPTEPHTSEEAEADEAARAPGEGADEAARAPVKEEEGVDPDDSLLDFESEVGSNRRLYVVGAVGLALLVAVFAVIQSSGGSSAPEEAPHTEATSNETSNDPPEQRAEPTGESSEKAGAANDEPESGNSDKPDRPDEEVEPAEPDHADEPAESDEPTETAAKKEEEPAKPPESDDPEAVPAKAETKPSKPAESKPELPAETKPDESPEAAEKAPETSPDNPTDETQPDSDDELELYHMEP